MKVTNVRLLRVSQGLSVSEIARFLNCSPSFLSRIEQGKVAIPLKKKRALARLFGVPEGLIGG